MQKPTGEKLTLWVQDDKQGGEHCVSLDLDISSDYMERYLTPDAAIDLGLVLIDIGRKIKGLQMAKMQLAFLKKK